MKDVFEASVWELNSYLEWTLSSLETCKKIRVLDWTDSLDDDGGYATYFAATCNYYDADSPCRCRIDTFSDKYPDDDGGLEFHNISANDIGEDHYDLVVLRRLTKHDNGIGDVIKRAAKALKDSGVLYANLVITSELEQIFKTAERCGLYPVAASKIIMSHVRPEYSGTFGEEKLVELYDMQGYIQLAFKK